MSDVPEGKIVMLEYREGKFTVRATDEPNYKGLRTVYFEAAIDEIRRLFGQEKKGGIVE